MVLGGSARSRLECPQCEDRRSDAQSSAHGDPAVIFHLLHALRASGASGLLLKAAPALCEGTARGTPSPSCCFEGSCALEAFDTRPMPGSCLADQTLYSQHSAWPSSATATFGTEALPPHRTAWDALADTQPDSGEDLSVRGKWGDLLASIPEGRNYLWHTDRGGGKPLFGWRRRYWSFLLKLAKSRPSWTIQAQPGPAIGPFHWANRRLSIRELCRLQTFPDDVFIAGDRGSVQRQIGNAVPSLLAEVLGREIRTQLLESRPARVAGALKLLPLDRSPAPPAERVRPVPKRYWGLLGRHSPHPGTGKGHAASQRAGRRLEGLDGPRGGGRRA